MKSGTYTLEAVQYIAKIADGGCRDSISLMEKALAYSPELTLKNVITALGTTDYQTMFSLASYITEYENDKIIECVENLYNSGKDVKQFVKQFTQFLLDVQKYAIMEDKAWRYINIPHLNDYEGILKCWEEDERFGVLFDMLDVFIKLSASIKYSSTPKDDIEAAILLYTAKED